MKAADAAVRDGDAEQYAALVHEFHDLIVVGADNSKLEAHYRTLMNQNLIQAKDGDGAERVMREHLRMSHQALMAGMDERRA